ncbi:MAG: chemotaxis protein CheX [Thermoguttaceae bacterium]
MMNPEYIDHFITAAVSTFDAMLGCALTPQKMFTKVGLQPQYEVSGVIGLSSKKARGTVVLSLSQEAALSATGAMLGERPAQINADVTDAVGELTNIIAGAAKAKLEHLALDLSLPMTVIGKNHMLGFPQDAISVCIPYGCAWGDLAVEVALVEKAGQTQHDNDLF